MTCPNPFHSTAEDERNAHAWRKVALENCEYWGAQFRMAEEAGVHPDLRMTLAKRLRDSAILLKVACDFVETVRSQRHVS